MTVVPWLDTFVYLVAVSSFVFYIWYHAAHRDEHSFAPRTSEVPEDSVGKHSHSGDRSAANGNPLPNGHPHVSRAGRGMPLNRT